MFYKYRWVFIVLYIVFGLYFINYPFGFFEIPAAVENLNSWIIFIGGVLILFGGISYFKTSRYRVY